MKRVLPILLAAAMLLTLMSGCSATQPTPEPSQSAESPQASEPVGEQPEQETTGVTVNLAAIKGPSAMGLAKLIEDNPGGQTASGGYNSYEVTLASAPDEVTAKVITGEYDIAAVPSNVAAVLYQKTQGQIQAVAIGTLGVLYILENSPEGYDGEPVTSLEQLSGSTIYSTAQGSNTEYILNYLLRQAGLEPGVDVTVEFFGAHDELVAFAAGATEHVVCMLPQPSATVLTVKDPSFEYALDLTQVWNETAEDGSKIAMTAIVAQKSFIEENPEAIAAFLKDYEASIDYVNSNISEAAQLIEKFEITASAAIAEKSLPMCNLVYIAGADMQKTIGGYYNVLFESEPSSIGGAVPDEGFYYAVK